jgi:xylan 1,4-beta-xylosidase
MGDIKHYMKAGSKTIDLCITDLPPHASFAIETLDDTHGNALRAFQQLGSPETPTREQSEWMKKQSMATLTEEVKADANGTLRIRRVLQPWTLMLFRQIKP